MANDKNLLIMSYLRQANIVEGYVAKWLMENPDRIDEVSPYWFWSPVGKSIVWAIIFSRREGEVTLESMKAVTDWSRTKAKPEHYDMVLGQAGMDETTMLGMVEYFKTINRITEIKEKDLSSPRPLITERESAAITKIIELLKTGQETPKLHKAVKALWIKICKPKNKKLKQSRAEQIEALKEQEELIKKKYG